MAQASDKALAMLRNQRHAVDLPDYFDASCINEDGRVDLDRVYEFTVKHHPTLEGLANKPVPRFFRTKAAKKLKAVLPSDEYGDRDHGDIRPGATEKTFSTPSTRVVVAYLMYLHDVVELQGEMLRVLWGLRDELHDRNRQIAALNSQLATLQIASSDPDVAPEPAAPVPTATPAVMTGPKTPPKGQPIATVVPSTPMASKKSTRAEHGHTPSPDSKKKIATGLGDSKNDGEKIEPVSRASDMNFRWGEPSERIGKKSEPFQGVKVAPHPNAAFNKQLFGQFDGFNRGGVKFPGGLVSVGTVGTGLGDRPFSSQFSGNRITCADPPSTTELADAKKVLERMKDATKALSEGKFTLFRELSKDLKPSQVEFAARILENHSLEAGPAGAGLHASPVTAAGGPSVAADADADADPDSGAGSDEAGKSEGI
ncbi:hypothetical protein BDR26DRAFT_872254 [Obelidium mucronatum]|nr:hypothetical protein BDR26DRAFT_872254 [Obelidium mucronatum]